MACVNIFVSHINSKMNKLSYNIELLIWPARQQLVSEVDNGLFNCLKRKTRQLHTRYISTPQTIGAGALCSRLTLSQRLRWSMLFWCNAWTTATPYSLGHPSQPQTSSSEYWMLPLVSSATCGSTTADSAISCTMSCTGWTFLSGCSTSCEQRSINVCNTKHHSTWRTAASTPQILLVASIVGPPAAISCSYRDTVVPCSVVGPFL